MKRVLPSVIFIIALLTLCGCQSQYVPPPQTSTSNYEITKISNNVYHIYATDGSNQNSNNYTFQHTLDIGLTQLIHDTNREVESIVPLSDHIGYGSATSGLIVIFKEVK